MTSPDPTRIPGVTLRVATVEDAAVILELIRDLADYERLSHELVADEERIRETLFGRRPAAEALIAEDRGAAVGFALFFHNYSTFLARPGLYLEDIYVRPSARGRGIGRALLVELAKIAVERGCGRMEWSVLNWNEPAIAFYRKLGAVAMDEWTVFRLTGGAIEELARGGGPRS
jgi:GNAT superfamily N-acetyltransferase